VHLCLFCLLPCSIGAVLDMTSGRCGCIATLHWYMSVVGRSPCSVCFSRVPGSQQISQPVSSTSLRAIGSVLMTVLFLSVLSRRMQRQTISHLENKKREVFQWDQVVGRQKPAHHQKYCSDTICGGCINVSSHLYDFVAAW
jgi:hypothetical protein